MDPQELLTAPASTLTRKQRRDRAALKRKMAEAMKLPAGYALGRTRRPVEQWAAEMVVDDKPFERLFGQAIELGKVDPRGGHVMVRMLDQPPYAVGKP